LREQEIGNLLGAPGGDEVDFLDTNLADGHLVSTFANGESAQLSSIGRYAGWSMYGMM